MQVDMVFVLVWLYEIECLRVTQTDIHLGNIPQYGFGEHSCISWGERENRMIAGVSVFSFPSVLVVFLKSIDGVCQ